MVPPLGFALEMAPTNPGKWHSCTLSVLWLRHGGTSSEVGTGGEVHRVPTRDVPLGIHQHQAASLPPH